LVKCVKFVHHKKGGFEGSNFINRIYNNEEQKVRVHVGRGTAKIVADAFVELVEGTLDRYEELGWEDIKTKEITLVIEEAESGIMARYSKVSVPTTWDKEKIEDIAQKIANIIDEIIADATY